MDRDQNELNQSGAGLNTDAPAPNTGAPAAVPAVAPEQTQPQHTPAPVGEQASPAAQPYQHTHKPINSEPGPYGQQSPAAGYIPQPQYRPYTQYGQPNGAPNTVYVNNSQAQQESPDKPKKQKKSSGVGSMIAVAIICVIVSGLAAFGGTMAARNFPTGDRNAEAAAGNAPTVIQPSNNSAAPSVIFKTAENPNKEAGTYTQVAEAVAPAVVEITTESIATDSYLWGNYVTEGAGSGVIISADGVIVTNNHVVSGASNITVTMTDGTSYPATVIGTDSDSDVAVIRIAASDLPFALLGDSDSLTVGEEVVAVGNPLGELGGTVTNGIVSALSRDISIEGTEMTLIQTNAAVNPGNSGGGLFNMYGELIGIVNAKTTTTSSGTSVEGIGFAIPINTASKVVEELVEYGYVRGRVMLGITYFEVEDTYDAFYYRVNALGVYVATSEYNTELKAYDRIVAIDGTEVTYGADIKSAIKDHEVGDEIEITVVRDGKYVTVKAKLYEYVPQETDESESGSSDFEENFDR